MIRAGPHGLLGEDQGHKVLDNNEGTITNREVQIIFIALQSLQRRSIGSNEFLLLAQVNTQYLIPILRKSDQTMGARWWDKSKSCSFH